MIASDSTSYPTHAVIIHHDITDGRIRQAVWALSEAIFRFMSAQPSLAAHPMGSGDVPCLQAYRTLMSSTMRRDCSAHAVAEHLVDNHRRSVAYLRATAIKK